MGDSRGEGERNFWNGKESVTATKKPSIFEKKPLNKLASVIKFFYISQK